MTTMNLTTNRILQHLTDESQCAIISPYRSERTKKENELVLKKLKARVRQLGFGFSEFISRWSEQLDDGSVCSFDERSLLIMKISRKQAMDLGRLFDQSSIIFKNDEKCAEICTRELIEVEQPKPSMFAR